MEISIHPPQTRVRDTLTVQPGLNGNVLDNSLPLLLADNKFGDEQSQIGTRVDSVLTRSSYRYYTPTDFCL